MPYKYLKVTRDEHITSVTLNRPETANASFNRLSICGRNHEQ
jgi:hypothetical protein